MAAYITFVFVAQHCPAMRTAVVQDINLAFIAAHQEHWLATYHKIHVVARLMDLRYVAGVDPSLVENICEFVLEDPFVGIATAMDAVPLNESTTVG